MGYSIFFSPPTPYRGDWISRLLFIYYFFTKVFVFTRISRKFPYIHIFLNQNISEVWILKKCKIARGIPGLYMKGAKLWHPRGIIIWNSLISFLLFAPDNDIRIFQLGLLEVGMILFSFISHLQSHQDPSMISVRSDGY